MDGRFLKPASSVGVALALAAFAWACGEDEGATGSDLAPQIVELTPECGPSTDPQRYEGQVLTRVDVRVTDADGDADYATIAVGGTVFRVDEPEADGDELLFSYQVPDDTSLLRCEAGTVILVRVVDEAGHVTEGEAEIL